MLWCEAVTKWQAANYLYPHFLVPLIPHVMGILAETTQNNKCMTQLVSGNPKPHNITSMFQKILLNRPTNHYA